MKMKLWAHLLMFSPRPVIRNVSLGSSGPKEEEKEEEEQEGLKTTDMMREETVKKMRNRVRKRVRVEGVWTREGEERERKRERW